MTYVAVQPASEPALRPQRGEPVGRFLARVQTRDYSVHEAGKVIEWKR